MQPPVPAIAEAIWPKTDKYDALADLGDDSDDLNDDHSGQQYIHRPIGE